MTLVILGRQGGDSHSLSELSYISMVVLAIHDSVNSSGTNLFPDLYSLILS